MLWLKSIVVCAFLSCVFDVVGADDKDKVAADQEALQGTWVVVSAELDGKSSESSKGDTFTFAGRELTIENKVRKSKPEGFKLDPTKTPREIDIDGKPASLGIYELKGDELKLCYGEKRPAGFESTNGLLLVLKRAKP